jgi:hypothetical protein
LCLPTVLDYDPCTCRIFAAALIQRYMRDLRLHNHRANAAAWFEGGECRLWCEAAGLSLERVFARVEQEMGKPVRKRPNFD